MAPIIDITPGDITTERTDMVLNPTSRGLDFGGEVSKAIIEKGSDKIRKDSLNLGNQMRTDGFVIVDTNGALNAPACMSIDCTPDKDKLAEIFGKAMPEMQRRGVKGFSVPAIGAGAQGLDFTVSAQVVVSALLKFFGDQGAQVNFLDQVRIVIFRNDEGLQKYRDKFDALSGKGSHVKYVGPQAANSVRWANTNRSDPNIASLIDSAQQPGHHITRVRRADYAEELAGSALASLATNVTGASLASNVTASGVALNAADAMNAALDSDEEGDFEMVTRDDAGMPAYRLSYKRDQTDR